jgi:hypothetical protein
MPKLDDHTRCPNPQKWGSWSTVKTVYVRDTDPNTGKQKWIPVGRLCMGCGVFRHELSGWFPSGKVEPKCKPFIPDKEPVPDPKPKSDPVEIEIDALAVSNPDHEPVTVDVVAMVDETPEFSYTLEAHTDYGGPGKGLDLDKQDPPVRSPGPGRPRTRISPEMVAGLLQISPEEVREKLRTGDIPGKKDPWRHWRVDLKWYENKSRALK